MLCRSSRLHESWTQWVVNHNRSSISQSFGRMMNGGCHHSRHSWPRDLSDAIDRQLQLALDDVPDFFLLMKMLVNGRTLLEFIVANRHSRRLETTPKPPRQA